MDCHDGRLSLGQKNNLRELLPQKAYLTIHQQLTYGGYGAVDRGKKHLNLSNSFRDADVILGFWVFGVNDDVFFWRSRLYGGWLGLRPHLQILQTCEGPYFSFVR